MNNKTQSSMNFFRTDANDYPLRVFPPSHLGNSSELDCTRFGVGSRCPKQITAEMIPQGDSPEAMKDRQRLILQFYTWWGYNHPSKKIFNSALQEDIFVSYRSKQETSRHAAKKYESSLAILHLDEILAGAVPILSSNADPGTKSQSRYERIILMKYVCADIGTVKMTVGVFKKTHKKEQYCITVIEADIEDAFKTSEKHKNKKNKIASEKKKTKKPQKQKRTG